MGEANLLALGRDEEGAPCVGPLRLPATVADARRQLGVDARLKVAIRPEAWRVGEPEANGLAGVVLKSAYLGPVLEYTIDTDVGTLFVVSSPEHRLRAPGERVSLTLEGEGIALVEADEEDRGAKSRG
ncbi:MAG TPA: TOBE domain-containing protein [Burkholderiaceae bacterium]